MSYLVRTIDAELDSMMTYARAISLDGPKGVGKTETAVRRADQVWSLDNPDQAEVIRSDFALSTIRENGTVLIDEWQHVPQVWDSVRRQVDAHAPAGRFLLTGSATPVSAAGTHSGAGRIFSVRMRPMGLHERGLVTPTVSLTRLLDGVGEISGSTDFALADYVSAITASGFPGVQDYPERGRAHFLDSYIQRVIDRDIPDLGATVRRPDVLRHWLAAYAAATSTTTMYSRLLDAASAGDGEQPSRGATTTYREHLSRLWLLDPVPGWLPNSNAFTNLRQGPKLHLADPALAARLLKVTASSLLTPRGSSKLGPLFESLVTLGVRVMAQAAGAQTYHMRTKDGSREIDLVIEGPEGQVLAIEVKLAAAVSDADVKHLLWLREKLPEQVLDTVVITTGKFAYRRPDGVAVIPLALLGA